ncbi:hypothetical protein BJX64DRAFT_293723 [Aspergillus heterothallicus]
MASTAPTASERLAAELGNFARLPYDIREMISLNITYPDHEFDDLHTLDAYVPILSTSATLKDETEHLLFSGSVLEIDFASITWLKFSRDHNKRGRFEQGHTFLQASLVTLLSKYNVAGLGAFPWDLLGRIEIILGAIHPGDSDAALRLWTQIREVVDQLRNVRPLPHLILHLKGSEVWFLKESLGDDFDYRFFIRAFGHLQDNARTVKVRSDSDSDSDANSPKICWKSMRWVFGAHLEVSPAAEAYIAAAPDMKPNSVREPGNNHDLQVQLARDWYIMCFKAARPGRSLGPSAGFLIKAWCSQGASGRLDFEEQFYCLLYECPEFICEVDFSLSLLAKMRHSLNNGEGSKCGYDVTSSINLHRLSEAIGDATLKFWRMCNANRMEDVRGVVR